MRRTCCSSPSNAESFAPSQIVINSGFAPVPSPSPFVSSFVFSTHSLKHGMAHLEV